MSRATADWRLEEHRGLDGEVHWALYRNRVYVGYVKRGLDKFYAFHVSVPDERSQGTRIGTTYRLNDAINDLKAVSNMSVVE